MKTYKSYAKINLFLSISDRLDNGYHKINTIMQKISLYDEIHFDVNKDYFKCTDKTLELDDNLILKAKRIMEETVGRELKVGIFLDKNIPYGAGLGGGSSNAAVTMVALNELFDLGLSMDNLRSLAANVGMDVPFFIDGFLAICTGRGDIIEVRDPIKLDHILLFRKSDPLSTPAVYKNMKVQEFSKKDPYEAYEQLKNGDYSCMINDLEHGAFRVLPSISNMKDLVCTKKVMLSGSGNVFFAIYDSKEAMNSDYEFLKTKVDEVKKVHTMWRQE